MYREGVPLERSVSKYLKTILIKGYRPSWWFKVAFPEIVRWSLKSYFFYTRSAGYNIPTEDWDNIVILDACRYDMFEELIAGSDMLQGQLEKKHSKATSTHKFLERNFDGVSLHDTVYVTGNPMHRWENVNVDLDSVFYDIVDVWEDGWHSGLNTVLPKTVFNAAKNATERYPDKRLIVHFVQPHHPFIGQRGSEIEDGGMYIRDLIESDELRTGKKVWRRLEDGDVSRRSVTEAYSENLRVVLPFVNALSDVLEGKTIVTSDHGNQLGEFAWPFPIRIYGHPEDIFTRQLSAVPWLVVHATDGKEAVAEEPISHSRDHSRDIEDRLKDLGYKM